MANYSRELDINQSEKPSEKGPYSGRIISHNGHNFSIGCMTQLSSKPAAGLLMTPSSASILHLGRALEEC